jgi:hypothetical protein
MGFGNLDTHRIPRLTNYEQALIAWQTRPPLYVKGDPNIRRLGKKTQKYLQLWKDDAGNINCQLHQTVVVRYRPDGRIELRPYPSLTTSEVVQCLLPSGVYVEYRHPVSNLGVIGLAERVENTQYRYYWQLLKVSTAYRISPHAGSDRPIVLRRQDGLWAIENMDEITVPFRIPRVNLKAAKAAYAQYKLGDFHVWAAATVALGDPIKPSLFTELSSPEGRVEALQDPDSWMLLLQHVGRITMPRWYGTEIGKIPSIIKQLREDIRRITLGALHYEDKASVPWPELQSIRKAQLDHAQGGQP